RANDTADLAKIIQFVITMAKRVFIPSALGALVCGLIMAWSLELFGMLWVILGLVGFATTFGMGIAVLTPRSDRGGELLAKEGVTAAAVEQSREILRIAQFDMTMLFVVVADMVLKPAPENYVVLLVMALVIVAAGLVFLRPVFAPAMPQRA